MIMLILNGVTYWKSLAGTSLVVMILRSFLNVVRSITHSSQLSSLPLLVLFLLASPRGEL